MKLFKIDFESMYPVGCCLIILAESVADAAEIASNTIMHTSKFSVEEILMDKSRVVVFQSGDY